MKTYPWENDPRYQVRPISDTKPPWNAPLASRPLTWALCSIGFWSVLPRNITEVRS